MDEEHQQKIGISRKRRATEVWLDSCLAAGGSTWVRYGAAILAVAAALLIDQADFLSGAFRIYLVFYPFIIIVTLYGGLGPGLLAIALSCLAIAFFWIEPVGTFAIAARADRISMTLFIIGNLFFVGICERLRRAIRQAAQAEAYRASEGKFRIVADNTYDWEFWLSPESEFLYTSPSCLRITGHSAEEFQKDPELFLRILHPEDRSAYLQHRAYVSETKTTGEIEFRVIRPDGTERWIAHACQPVFSAEGQYLGVRGSNRDITERKHAEGEQQRNRNMLMQIIDSVPQSVFWKDRNSVYLGCNEVFAQAVGLASKEEIAGKTDFDLPWPHQEAEAYIADDREVMENNRPKHHILEPLQQADGTRLWIDTTKVPLTDSGGSVFGILGVYEDITERKHAEEALRESEAFNISLRDSLIEHIAVLDAQGVIIAVNREWQKFAEENGAPELAVKSVGMNYLAICEHAVGLPHGEGATVARDGILAVLSGAQAEFNLEYPCHSPEKKRWFEMHVCPLQGAKKGVVVAHLDITQRWLAEETLRESQEQLRSLVEQAPITVAMFDRNMNYIATSKRWLAEYGRGHTDLTGLNHYDIKYDMPDYWRDVHQKALTGEPQECEEDRWVQADGTVSWLRWVVHPWRDTHHQIGGLIISTEDITKRKEAEEALRQSEAFLRMVCETTPDPIFAKDRESRLLMANPSTLRVFGKPLEEVLGRRDDELYSDVETGRTVIENDQRVIESGVAEVFEETIITPYGKRVFLCTKTPYLDADGVIIGTIGVARDITERKQTEEALKRAKEDAEAANLAKDRFLAILSHELRTPLTPALMTVSAHEKDAALTSEFREDLATARRNLELEARLIDDLLDLNRLVRGKIELRRQPRDLHHVLENVLEICRVEAATKGLVVRWEPAATAHNVNGDDGRLQQVFWNLLKNAIKFTPPGGTITVRSFNLHEDIVRVEVADTGIGINPEIIPRLFVAFEQGELEAKTQFGGLGLGLAICKAVVDLHGGKIWVESGGPGKGSTFVVEMPASSSQISMEERPRPMASVLDWKPETGGHKLKILLVEDNEDTLRILGRFLEKAGCKVIPVQTIKAALSNAQSARERAEQFDLVISDLGLPDGDGRDLMRELRDRDGLSGIAISGYGMEDDIEKSRAAGFAEHLTKPIQIEELQAAISEVLRH